MSKAKKSDLFYSEHKKGKYYYVVYVIKQTKVEKNEEYFVAWT